MYVPGCQHAPQHKHLRLLQVDVYEAKTATYKASCLCCTALCTHCFGKTVCLVLVFGEWKEWLGRCSISEVLLVVSSSVFTMRLLPRNGLGLGSQTFLGDSNWAPVVFGSLQLGRCGDQHLPIN